MQEGELFCQALSVWERVAGVTAGVQGGRMGGRMGLEEESPYRVWPFQELSPPFSEAGTILEAT